MKSSQLQTVSVGVLAIAILLFATAARAADWIGGAAGWSSTGNPGWNGSVPNSQGAVAQWVTPQAQFPETYQDIGGGVTVGAINYGNNNDMGAIYWYVSPDQGITLDQDGGGAGFATISNTSTNSSDLNVLWINTGTLTLADDLHVINTANNSVNVNGAIQLTTTLAGAGNITFNSTGPIASTATSSPGAIWLNQANTFTGNVLVQQGLVIVDNGSAVSGTDFTPFGNLSNVVTIGESGAGSAAVLARLNNAPLNSYSIVIAPAAVGETRTFGAASNGNFTVSSGSVTMNGDLNLRSGTTSQSAMQAYTGNFSGAGNLNKVGSAVAVLSGTNTNSGTTTVSEGTLVFATPESLYNNQQGSLAGYWSPSKIVVQPGASLGFNVGSAGEFSDAQIQAFNSMGTGVGGFLPGSNLALNPSVDYTYAPVITDASGNSIGFTKVGPNVLTLTASNTYTGGTKLNGGKLSLGSLGAINSAGTISFGGGTLQHTAVNTTDYSSRFSNAANQAYSIDTNGQNVSYAAGLSSTGGSFTKLGAGTLTLSGTNTYTGVTTLSDGTVKLTGSNTSSRIYNVGTTAGLTANLEISGGGSLSVGDVGQEFVTPNLGYYQEFYLGYAGGTGNATVAAGTTLTVNGWSNIARGGGTSTFDNAGTFNTTQELRIAPNYGEGPGTATFNNNGGTVSANVVFVGQGTGSTATVTQSAGAFNSNYWITLGEEAGSTGTFNLNGGSVSTGNVDYQHLVLGFAGTGNFKQTAGSVSLNGALVVGWTASAIGNYQMDSGTLTTVGPIQLGIDAGSDGTFVMNNGTINCADWVVTGTFGGTGHFTQHGGAINTVNFDVAQVAGAVGDYTMDNAVASSSISTTGFFAVGDGGSGTFNLVDGTINVGVGINGDFYVGAGATGVGVLTQTAGSITTGNWSYIGESGSGTYHMNGGTYSGGDNVSIGNAASGVGVLNLNAGTFTVLGNDPAFTGNLLVGNAGLGTLNQSGGTLSMPANTATTNSARTAAIAMNPAIAVDGNIMVGSEATGNGTVNQTGGMVSVSANILLGLNGVGTWTQSAGSTAVGVVSPTGGDLVLGLAAGSSGAYNLQGGVLDVTRGTGTIGRGLGSGTFAFTGGTLKVKEYNVGDFGGDLGGLTQTGATSVLDVTGNNTQLNGGYTLTDGTALVAKQLTVNGDVNLSSNGELQWQMTGLNSANPGQWFGQIALTGNLVLGGTSEVELDFSPLATDGPAGTHTYWDANHSWKIIDTTTNTGSTTFATLTNGTFANGTFSIVVGTGADLGDIFLNYAAVGPAVPGDFDGDGDVDGADFVAWQTHFPTGTGAVYGDGDADFDGDVDGADFVVWQTNFPFTPGPGASPVPEPAGLLLAAASAMGLVVVGRRARRSKPTT